MSQSCRDGREMYNKSVMHVQLCCFAYTAVMYRSNRRFNIPPGIQQAFDTFHAVPGRREFDYQSLLGGGEFDPHALGVEEFKLHPRFHMKSLGRVVQSWVKISESTKFEFRFESL